VIRCRIAARSGSAGIDTKIKGRDIRETEDMKPIVPALALALALLVGALPGASVAAPKYKVAKVVNGGTIFGKVVLSSGKAVTKSYTISKNPEVCGTGTRDVPMVRTNGKALLDAVVYLEKVKAGKPFPAGLGKITLNQKKCAFQPAISVMMNGGELEAVNSDPVLHNIHTYELIGRARRTVMNVSQPEKGNIVTKKIKMRRGVGMKVECDAHDFMHAFVFVARNPYFALVDDKGEYSITDVPPGKYTIKVWHGVLGEKKGKAIVPAGGRAEVTFGY